MKILIFLMIGMAVTLDLLEIDKHVLVFEFSFSCGNSYLMNKKIVADISNELKKEDVDFSYELDGKKNFSGIFNIYEKIGDRLVVLATNDKKSKLYQEVLNNYPSIFYNSFIDTEKPTEQEVEARKLLIRQLIMNLNKN